MAYDVFQIAAKIIAQTDVDSGDNISNLKLQKLLYYMQGFFLAIFDKPLFEEEIEAWMYGPVVPAVYEKYNVHSSNGIKIPNEDPICLTEEEEDIFNQVYCQYGQFSALKLMQMTHNEDPWRSVEPGKGHIIPKTTISRYFALLIEEDNG